MSTINQHIYLISDSTGETVSTIARSIYARFENINFLENKWALIRTEKQIDNIINILKDKKGIVLYTMINTELENYLIEECQNIKVIAHNVLDNTLNKIKKFYEDVCLLEQPFVIDNKIKIKDVISEFNKNNNLDLTIKNYFIFKLGL